MEDLFGGESISYIILSTWQKWQGQDFFNLFAPPFCAFRQPKTHPLIVNLREVHPQKRPKSKHREQEKSLCFKSLIRQTMKSKKMRFFSKNNTKNKIIPILPSPLYTPACLTSSIPSWPKGYFVICYFVIFCFLECGFVVPVEKRLRNVWWFHIYSFTLQPKGYLMCSCAARCAVSY